MATPFYLNTNPMNALRYNIALKDVLTTGNEQKDYLVIANAASLTDVAAFMTNVFVIGSLTGFNLTHYYIIDTVSNVITPVAWTPTNVIGSIDPSLYTLGQIPIKGAGLVFVPGFVQQMGDVNGTVHNTLLKVVDTLAGSSITGSTALYPDGLFQIANGAGTGGTARLGDAYGDNNSTSIVINDATANESIVLHAIKLIELDTAGNVSIGNVTANTTEIFLSDTTKDIQLRCQGLTKLGDVLATANKTEIVIDDPNKKIDLTSLLGTVNIGDTGGVGNGTKIIVNDTAKTVRFVSNVNTVIANTTHKNAIFDTVNYNISLGDVDTVSNGTLITVNNPDKSILLNVNAISGHVNVAGLRIFASNALALLGGLIADDVYKTVTGELRIVV